MIDATNMAPCCRAVNGCLRCVINFVSLNARWTSPPGDRILLAALSRLLARSGLPALLLMALRPVAAELEHRGGVFDASTTNSGWTSGSLQQQSGRVKAGDLWPGLRDRTAAGREKWRHPQHHFARRNRRLVEQLDRPRRPMPAPPTRRTRSVTTDRWRASWGVEVSR